MGTLDTSPIPPWAITIWRGDDSYIYCALPMTAGGVPYVTRYLASEGGLSAALDLLRKRKAEVLDPLEAKALFNPRPNPTANQPMVKTSKAHERLKAETTEAQRESARRLVAKLGIK